MTTIGRIMIGWRLSVELQGPRPFEGNIASSTMSEKAGDTPAPQVVSERTKALMFSWG